MVHTHYNTMVGTRNKQYPTDVAHVAPAPQHHTTTALSAAAASQPPSTSTSIQDIFSNIQGELSGLSPEIKAVVGAIFKAFEVYSVRKDQELADLRTTVGTLESRITQLEDQLDDVNQYERRDTIIISGPDLPQETSGENATNVVVDTIKHALKVNISPSDINVAHRLGGNKKPNSKKPMIVKLHSRLKKDELMSTCVTVRPNIYINESLTPKRRSIFKTIWNIRKHNRNLFQQCYTRDGKIYIKLRCSDVKHAITTENALTSFLDKFPVLRDNIPHE